MGGLFGCLLFCRLIIVFVRIRKLVGFDFLIIGVGGIDSVEIVWIKIMVGVDLL